MLARRWRDAAITAAALPARASHAHAARPAAAPQRACFSAEGLARLDRYMQSGVDGNQIAGAVALIRRNGQTAYFKSFGLRDLAARVPMMPDSIFGVYSMSKPITTVAARMLVEEGRLRLDDPLPKYIPAFADVKVGGETKGEDSALRLALEPAKRSISIQDLMRHLRADLRLLRRGTGQEGLGRRTQTVLDRARIRASLKNAEEHRLRRFRATALALLPCRVCNLRKIAEKAARRRAAFPWAGVPAASLGSREGADGRHGGTFPARQALKRLVRERRDATAVRNLVVNHSRCNSRAEPLQSERNSCMFRPGYACGKVGRPP